MTGKFNDRGLRAYNIDPGYVPTEAQLAKHGKDDPIYQQYISQGAPVEVPAKMLIWLLTHEDLRRTRRISTFMKVVGEALLVKRSTIEGPFPDAPDEAIVEAAAMADYGVGVTG